MEKRVKKRGIYFLANDAILELAIAFLNSVRKHNPHMPVCLIPFNGDCARVEALREKYQFSIFRDEAVLRQCDEVSLRFDTWVRGQYRKLAIWQGEFDEFLYIDTDTVVLQNLDPVFEYLDRYAFVAPHSGIPGHRRFVWNDSIYQAVQLTAEQIAYSANTGFLCSRKDALPCGDLSEKLRAALDLAPHMALFCAEQPLLNYLIVTSGKPYTSLLELGDVPQVQQAARKIPGSPPALIMHWAGLWTPGPTERWLMRVLKRLRLIRELPNVRLFLPRKALWNYYRALDQGSYSTLHDSQGRNTPPM